jgi:hypothetical protein
VITNDIAAIRADHTTYQQAAADSRRAEARPVLAAGLAARVPALCDEVEQLRAEISQLRAEHTTAERLVMDTIIATPHPALPYRSATVDGLSGVIVRADSAGVVVVDGLTHTGAAALELSAAITRAVRNINTGACRG